MQSHLHFNDKHASQSGWRKNSMLEKPFPVKEYHRGHTVLTLMVATDSCFTTVCYMIRMINVLIDSCNSVPVQLYKLIFTIAFAIAKRTNTDTFQPLNQVSFNVL